MKLKQLISSLDILESTASEDMEIASVSFDSRTAELGCLFVAFAGNVFDGNAFIPMAVEKGAVAVVCERKPDPAVEIPYVLVPNGRSALAKVWAGWFGYPSREISVIGVTGTNGKTTITYLLRSILEQNGAKTGLMGSIRNIIGDEVTDSVSTTPNSFQLPQLLRRMVDEDCRYAVMEVTSYNLAVDWVDGTEFSVGIFTNLTEDHLDFHKTMEAYGDAKARLFEKCSVCVMNRDDPSWEKMKAHAKGPVLTYSARDRQADLFAENIRTGEDGSEADFVMGGDVCHMELGLPGRFNVYNAMAAVLSAVTQGIDFHRATEALRSAKGAKGRMEQVPTPGQDFKVLIDYAHTPDGLENLLTTVKDFTRGRVILVFGCGGNTDPYKRPVMGEIAGRLADLTVVTSDNPRREEPMAIIEDIVGGMKHSRGPYVVIEDRREAIRWAMDNARKDDLVVLAGKGHETLQTVGTERIVLDERKVVAEHLERMKNRP